MERRLIGVQLQLLNLDESFSFISAIYDQLKDAEDKGSVRRAALESLEEDEISKLFSLISLFQYERAPVWCQAS